MNASVIRDLSVPGSNSFCGVSEVSRFRVRAYGAASCDLVSTSDSCVAYTALVYHGLKPAILYRSNTFCKIYGIPCYVNTICTTCILF